MFKVDSANYLKYLWWDPQYNVIRCFASCWECERLSQKMAIKERALNWLWELPPRIFNMETDGHNSPWVGIPALLVAQQLVVWPAWLPVLQLLWLQKPSQLYFLLHQVANICDGLSQAQCQQKKYMIQQRPKSRWEWAQPVMHLVCQ